MIENNGEKSQIIKLIKQSRTDNELKSMLIDLVNLLVVDNIDISELKNALRKTLSSNVIEDTQYDNDDLLNKLENNETKVQPKTKEELKQIIEDTIKKKGNDCNLNFIDTSLITDMSYMFRNSKFNGDISKWNVSKVKTMSNMFAYSNFNGDISKWNVSNVETMSNMFWESNFNSDISKWNVSNVKDMDEMFRNSKFDKDISKWDVSNVKDMDEMFDGCPLEDKPKYQPKFED